MFVRLITLLQIAAVMTKIPREKMRNRTTFYFNGIESRVMRGRGMNSINMSALMLKTPPTME